MSIPAIMRITTPPQRTPPQVVKSYLVCIAKMVSANVTPAQIPAAIRTASTWKAADTVPSMKPWQTGNKNEISG